MMMNSKFVRGLNIFSQPFFAATTTREQQRGVLLIIEFGDEEETEEEEIMLLLMMMMMPCALYRYIQREREKSEKLFFPLSSVPKVVLVRSDEWREDSHSFLLLSVCLRAREVKTCLCRFRSLSFVRVFLREVVVLGTTREAKKASERERERERAKERAHPKKDRKTHKDDRKTQKDRNRILGREDDIVSDDDDSDDEKISSSTPGKIS